MAQHNETRWTARLAAVVIPLLVASLLGCTPEPKPAQPSVVRVTAPAEPTVSGQEVSTQCFRFEMPRGYQLQDWHKETPCIVAINIKNGDSLTSILVGGNKNVEHPSTAQKFIDVATKAQPKSTAKIETIGGREVAVVDVKIGASNLNFRTIYVPDPREARPLAAATGFTIMGYGYNDALRQQLQQVAETLVVR